MVVESCFFFNSDKLVSDLLPLSAYCLHTSEIIFEV